MDFDNSDLYQRTLYVNLLYTNSAYAFWPQVILRTLNTGFYTSRTLHTVNYVYPSASGWTNGNENEVALQSLYTSAASDTSPLDLPYRAALQGANTASPVRTMSVPNLF